ncbi:putative ATP-dependent RNA helicase DHX57 [Episyrphus balteatus]|uniref:putative ATP-dependent RNA helicase DHX57 n=1 Tax=Episyrphus balteatus TaxID=286459 RepID=UPI0024865408|nr:putative ATP-dependent RNA helicase DHX57 [Episyrphus balteatus]
MDDSSQRLIEDCFLRPISDVRTSNTVEEPHPSKTVMKTELQVLRLGDDSQKLIMETLRSIYGDDFKLNDSSNYKDRGSKMKKSYWEDRGSLVVQSISNFSAQNGKLEDPLDRLQRFAIVKLENYGFPESHCIEALEHCEWNSDEALILLYTKYMGIANSKENDSASETSRELLLETLEDEKLVLESIYDNAFQEKEKNQIWNLKFEINHLLVHSPSEERKLKKANEAQLLRGKENKAKPKCKNFARGYCKFESKCRFSHVLDGDTSGKDGRTNASSDSEEKWFFLEFRFPKNSNYPNEAPFIFLKTTLHDIPRQILLKISRKLYEEAKAITSDGIPCVYTISEMLLDENISQSIKDDHKPFPNPEKSLFATENEVENETLRGPSKPLPTHYEKGQTGKSDGSNYSAQQVLREDKELISKFIEKQTNDKYKKMLTARKNLPAFAKMTDILTEIASSQVLVISGETGCGKSTQVPQFILDNWLYESSKLERGENPPHVEIVCTQPRRLSAIGVAERVANERAERVGQSVGYQIRMENKMSSATRLLFCTTGILLRRLASDPHLSSVSHVIVDEVHERSEESDFLLLILKRSLRKRKDLKVILMSATLNANLFSDYFGGAPVLSIPGRTFNVEQLFLEDILEISDYVMEFDSQYCRKIKKKEEAEIMRELENFDVQALSEPPPKNIKDENLNLSAIYARYSNYSKKTCKTIYLSEPMKINPELIEAVLKFIVSGDHDWPREGAILIFLPGLQEIQIVHEALSTNAMFGPKSGQFLLVPLHSTLTSEEQALVFRPAPLGKRKIVLSTNIAETSVTIDDCVFVVDCGTMKEKRFDSNRNMESLDMVWESRANAMQRKGRAGRVMPGVCIHLFTGHRFANNFLKQPVPEIHRIPLEQLVLRTKILPQFDGIKVLDVLGQTLEPPTEENIISAVTRLQNVGALDEDQMLTALGHHLSALPVDVRIGKLMLFGVIFQCLDSVLTIAACLSHKSPFVSPFEKRNEANKKKLGLAICNSDHLTCLQAYKKWLEISTRSRHAGRNFVEENFLSMNCLQTIAELKYQFLELLVSIGFVPINVPRRRKNAEDTILDLTGHALNINGENNRLLISLLSAALYPNIVKILTPEKTFIQTAAGAMPKTSNSRDLRFKTCLDGYVSIHPSSVNSDVGNFQSPFLVFHEKVKTSKIFIRECSMVPMFPLVLFSGSDLRIELHSGEFLVLLEEGWIILKAQNHEIAEMIQCLRIELFKLLEEKIKDPCLNLMHHENGQKIIRAIVHLVSK